MQIGADMARLEIENVEQWEIEEAKILNMTYQFYKNRRNTARKKETSEEWWDEAWKESHEISVRYENTIYRELVNEIMEVWMKRLQSLTKGEQEDFIPLSYDPHLQSIARVNELLNNPPTDERIEVRYKVDDGRIARVQITPEKRVKAVLD